MSFETKGKIVKILETQTGSSKNGEWKKQDFVVETAEAYPKKICFSIWNDKLSQLDGVEVGDEVRIMFSVASREYNNKWYSDITAYQIDNNSKKDYETSKSESVNFQEEKLNLDILASSNDSDDLPF
ncbi:hypothetical protein AD998_17450 [bacterium 336/3]|jgi:Domain of unknown function (DUF3127)|nr:hypothetical protein AD998_17450 [bacterium 336/3]